MDKILKTLGATLLALFAANAPADVISIEDLDNPTVIDFENLDRAVTITDQYSTLGVSFTNLCTQDQFDAGAGPGITAANFGCVSDPFGSITATFDTKIMAVGMFVTTNQGDDTTISAFLNGGLVGFETFLTSGAGLSGSFAGITFESGFDSISITALNNSNGAIGIDNFQFGGITTSVPEPGTLALLGLGLAGIGLARRRRV